MMLRAIKGFSLGGGRDVAAGDEFEELNTFQARYWMGLGYVEEVTPSSKAASPHRPERRANQKE